jgi:hypothetical protein
MCISTALEEFDRFLFIFGTYRIIHHGSTPHQYEHCSFKNRSPLDILQTAK